METRRVTVNLTEDEYRAIREGMEALVDITKIIDEGGFDEIVASRIYSLLKHKKYWIDQIEEMFPFEGDIHDLIWELDHLD